MLEGVQDSIHVTLYCINSCRMNSSGELVTVIILDPSLFTETAFSRCLEFLYTGTTTEGLNKESEQLAETMAAAELLNLPELKLICENARNGEEFLNPSIGTWLNDRNSAVAKELFLGKVHIIHSEEHCRI